MRSYTMNSRDTISIEEVAAREDHAELIDNNLIVIDQTSVAHNNAVLEIATALRQYIAANGGKCKVFTENVALYCDEMSDDDKGNLFLPDVMVVCDTEGIKNDGVHSAPVFVAEVTSESTKKNDYGRKMVKYSDIGVKEYWIVDLQRRVVVRYMFEKDYAPELIPYVDPINTKLAIKSYPELKIDLSSIFGQGESI